MRNERNKQKILGIIIIVFFISSSVHAIKIDANSISKDEQSDILSRSTIIGDYNLTLNTSEENQINNLDDTTISSDSISNIDINNTISLNQDEVNFSNQEPSKESMADWRYSNKTAIKYFIKHACWQRQGSSTSMRCGQGGEGAIYYMFSIGTSSVLEGSLHVGAKFASWTPWGWIDGPDMWVWDYSASQWYCRTHSMGTQDQRIWKYWDLTNSNKYISSSGIVKIRIFQEWWDDVILDYAGVKWQDNVCTIHFQATPTTGKIIFDGISYNHGNSVEKQPNTYPLMAGSLSDYSFKKWTGTGGVTIKSSTQQSTTAEVTGECTIKAEWVEEFEIKFYTNPSDKGSIRFDGTTYYYGDRTTKIANTYTATANLPSGTGWTFNKWEKIGSLLISTPNSQTTSVTVSGDGTLKAIFDPPPEYKITFYISPDTAGTIKCGTTSYSNGHYGMFPAGSYAFEAERSGSNYGFSQWATSGSVVIEEPDINPTTATISGSGSISAVFTKINTPPDQPTYPTPQHGQTNVPIDTTLSCKVSDPDGDSMDVTFYWSDDTIIGTVNNVQSGLQASIYPGLLQYQKSYSWYAKAYDGQDTTTSDTWSFTTASAPERWVLLVGASDYSDQAEYDSMNNCVWFEYSTLHNHELYDIPRDHMYLLASSYTPAELGKPTYDNGEPSWSKFKQGIDWLSHNADSKDLVYIFILTHGGQYQTPFYHYSVMYFSDGSSDTFISPIELAIQLAKINCKNLILVLNNCYSGGFISDCAGDNRVILTAVSASETANGMDYDYDGDGNNSDLEYNDTTSYSYFESAFNQAISGLADYNSDGAVTMKEAYDYCVANGHPDDNPQLGDSGNIAKDLIIGYLGLYGILYKIIISCDAAGMVYDENITSLMYNVTIKNDGDLDINNGKVVIDIVDVDAHNNESMYFEQHAINISANQQVIIPITWNSPTPGRYKTNIRVFTNETTLLKMETFGFSIGTQGTNPPEIPDIDDNPTLWQANQEYQLIFETTDPDDDDIEYFVDWGDLTNTGWLGPYNSGETISINKTWYADASYMIKAKARDIYGIESNWSEPFIVKIVSDIQTKPSFILGMMRDRRPCGDYIYFRVSQDTFNFVFSPMEMKFLSPGEEIIISKDYKFGFILEAFPEYLLAGFFPQFLILNTYLNSNKHNYEKLPQNRFLSKEVFQ